MYSDQKEFNSSPKIHVGVKKGALGGNYNKFKDQTLSMHLLCLNDIFDEGWSFEEVSSFLNNNNQGFELLLHYSYIGSTQSSLDVMRDHLETSYCIEKILEFSDLVDYDKKNAFPYGIKLQLVPINVNQLAALLLELCILDTISGDPDEVELFSLIESIDEYECSLQDRIFKFPLAIDDYYANLINGGIFELASEYQIEYDASSDDLISGDNDLLDIEQDEVHSDSYEIYLQRAYNENPEWQWGVWKSAASRTIGSVFYVSSYCWIIPSGSNTDRILDYYSGFKEKLIFHEAQLLEDCGNRIILNDFGAIYLESLKSIDAAIQCVNIRLASLHKLRLSQAVSISQAQFFISEYCDVLKIQFDQFNFLYFDFKCVGHVELRNILSKLAKMTYHFQRLLGINEDIHCSWNLLDEEKFEQLCYDIICLVPRFDNMRIRKMGKSKSRDGGRDIIVYTHPTWQQNSDQYIFQCKLIKSGKSLTKASVPEAANIIMEYGAQGYGIFTSTVIDSTLYDMLDGFSRNGTNTEVIFSVYELEHFLARNSALKKKYFGNK